MWTTYWKRFPLTQILIIGVCAALKLGYHWPWGQIAVLFAVMEVGGILGAWWGHRLRRRIERDDQHLPLERD